MSAADFAFNSIVGGGGLPAGTDIHIELPSAGVASTQTAQTAAIGVPALQTHA